jgi:hypothetical protein
LVSNNSYIFRELLKLKVEGSQPNESNTITGNSLLNLKAYAPATQNSILNVKKAEQKISESSILYVCTPSFAEIVSCEKKDKEMHLQKLFYSPFF